MFVVRSKEVEAQGDHNRVGRTASVSPQIPAKGEQVYGVGLGCPPWLSATLTATSLAPAWSLVGVHCIKPIAASIVIPVGLMVKK